MEKKLKKIMADIFLISIDQIDGSSTMENMKEWDSLKHVQLMMSIEEGFIIKLKIEEMIEMTSITNIKRTLSSKGIQF